MLTTFSNAAGTAKVLANQVYGPYGTQRYSSGTSMGTDKGFTGQYTDPFTGLDYYNARYYDPVVGVFLSADKVQGNPQGMNPYAYVQGNPETKNDPTGNKQVGACDPNSGIDCPPPPPPPGGGGPAPCHGDNHPWCNPDGGQPGPNPPAKGNCGGNLTAAQCANGQKSKDNKIANYHGSITWLKVAASGFTLIVDILQLVKDWSEATGIYRIIELLGDAISIIGDLSSIVSQIASAIHATAVQTAADWLGWVTNSLATVYKAARGVMHSPWGSLAQAAVVVAFYSLKVALFGGSLTSLVAPILFEIGEKATGLDGKKLTQAVVSVFQAAWQYDQYQIDVLNSESMPQYCQSNPGSC